MLEERTALRSEGFWSYFPVVRNKQKMHFIKAVRATCHDIFGAQKSHDLSFVKWQSTEW